MTPQSRQSRESRHAVPPASKTSLLKRLDRNAVDNPMRAALGGVKTAAFNDMQFNTRLSEVKHRARDKTS